MHRTSPTEPEPTAVPQRAARARHCQSRSGGVGGRASPHLELRWAFATVPGLGRLVTSAWVAPASASAAASATSAASAADGPRPGPKAQPLGRGPHTG